jgi:hypothetical protein
MKEAIEALKQGVAQMYLWAWLASDQKWTDAELKDVFGGWKSIWDGLAGEYRNSMWLDTVVEAWQADADDPESRAFCERLIRLGLYRP